MNKLDGTKPQKHCQCVYRSNLRKHKRKKQCRDYKLAGLTGVKRAEYVLRRPGTPKPERPIGKIAIGQ